MCKSLCRAGSLFAVFILASSVIAQKVQIVGPGGTPDGPPLDPSKFDQELVAELKQIWEIDQGIRQRVERIGAREGLPLPEVFIEDWKRADREAQRRLRAIVDKHGWPARSHVGDEGAMTAFLVIQHADLATQKEFLPQIEKAVAAGEAGKYSLAYLKDRIRIREGGKQIYGTQVSIDETGKAVAADLEDPENVDARRREVGLPPLDIYLKGMQQHGAMPQPQGASAGGAVNEGLREEITALHGSFRSIGPQQFTDTVTPDDRTWPADLKAKREEVRAKVNNLILKLLDQYGYPGPALLGHDGSQAFFSLLPHMPPTTRARALDLMHTAVERGEASKPQLAWLVDKCRLEEGKPQLYGTQVERDAEGKVVASKLQEPASVDDRRTAMGLPKLQDYLDALNGVGEVAKPMLKRG